MSQPRKPKGSPNSTGGQFDTTATTTGMGLPPMPDTTPQEPGPRPDTHRLVPRKPKGSPNSTGGQFDTTATTTGMGLPPMPDTTPQEPGPRPDTHRLVAAMRTMMPDRDWQPSETSPYTRTEIEQVAPVLDQYNIADSPLYTQVSRNWDVDMDTEEGLYTRFEHQPGRAASVARGMALWTYGMGRHIDTDEDRQDVENYLVDLSDGGRHLGALYALRGMALWTYGMGRHIDTDEDRQDVENYLVDLSDGGRHLGALYALRHAPHPPFSTVGRGLFTRMRLADTPIQAQYAMMTAYRYMYTHDLVDEGMEPLANPRVDSMMDEHFTGTMRGLYADMMDDYSHHQDPQVRRLAQAYTSAYNTLPTVRDADATIPPIRLGKAGATAGAGVHERIQHPAHGPGRGRHDPTHPVGQVRPWSRPGVGGHGPIGGRSATVGAMGTRARGRTAWPRPDVDP